MAKRPVFIPVLSSKDPHLVKEVSVEFKWHPGYAVSQKKKNIEAMHVSAGNSGIKNILEVSTKSNDELGQALSAFNLKLRIGKSERINVESAFQGSKVFETDGPFIDLYGKDGREIKKDNRLKNSGRLIGFRHNNEEWGLEPKTAFYDWLYIKALLDQTDITGQLSKYEAFTDIEFNPKKSISCQARTCAVFLALIAKGLIGKCMSNRDYFLSIIKRGVQPNQSYGKSTQNEFEF